MSKIFDGLQRTGGEIGELTVEVIGSADSAKGARRGSPAGKDGDGRENPEPAWPEEPEGSAQALEEESGGSYDSVSGELSMSPESDNPDVFSVLPEDGEFELPQDEEIKSAPPSSSSNGIESAVIRLQAGSPLLPFDAGEAHKAAEEYRRIRTRILQHPSDPRLMLVSSPAPGDGKSVTAINISAALALNPEVRVLLADLDLRRSTMGALLGVPERDGVAEVLKGSCRFEDAVLRLEPFPNLFLLPPGRDRTSPTELLSSPRWQALCDRFRSQMTYTIIDGPPVDAVAEYGLLQEPADGLILVVRTYHTGRSLLSSALECIPKDKLIGSVVNGHRDSLFWKQRTSYHYS